MSNESEDQPLAATNEEQMPQDETPAKTSPDLAVETDAATTEMETAVSPSEAETNPPKRIKAPSTIKRRGRPAGSSRKKQPTLRQVTDRFAACGRCSYFWAGYKVMLGEAALATAVDQSQTGWLSLEWNGQMLDLIHKSYGIRTDITHIHYEGCCKECRRPFIYQAADSEDEADSFQIAITPRVSHS